MYFSCSVSVWGKCFIGLIQFPAASVTVDWLGHRWLPCDFYRGRDRRCDCARSSPAGSSLLNVQTWSSKTEMVRYTRAQTFCGQYDHLVRVRFFKFVVVF